jgi:hypothetical protein
MKHLWNQSSYRCHDAASIVGKSPSKSVIIVFCQLMISLLSLQLAKKKKIRLLLGLFERTESSLDAAQKQCVVLTTGTQQHKINSPPACTLASLSCRSSSLSVLHFRLRSRC